MPGDYGSKAVFMGCNSGGVLTVQLAAANKVAAIENLGATQVRRYSDTNQGSNLASLNYTIELHFHIQLQWLSLSKC